MKIMVTGSEGFIGTNLIRYLSNRYPTAEIVRVDALTYASQQPFEEAARFPLEEINIQDQSAVARVMKVHRPNVVLHLAAESHVCRSITGPKAFMMTNAVGTFNMIEEFKELNNGGRFIHVSTDEVFGELEESDDAFNEGTTVKPRSPYAASKAASDHIVQSYFHTYGVDAIVTNCSNNFGPNQHDEKLIPRTIGKILQGEPVTVYGSGSQIRDWLHVDAHAEALCLLIEKGKSGERYCIGGEMEMRNREMIELVYKVMEHILFKEIQRKMVNTKDRPTDDYRYAINPMKLKQLGWNSGKDDFFINLEKTVRSYVDPVREN